MKQNTFYRTKYTFVLGKKDIEAPKGASKTVQDDSYTIAQIIERYHNGINPIQNEPMYMDEEDLDKIDGRFRADQDLNDVARYGHVHQQIQNDIFALDTELEKRKALTS